MCFNPLKGFIGENGQVFKVTKSDVLGLKYDNKIDKWIKYYTLSDIPDDAYTFIKNPKQGAKGVRI